MRRLSGGFAIATMFAGALIAVAAPAHSAGELTRIPLRPNVVLPMFWESAPNATATVILLPGGGGGFGRVEGGRPTSENFLTRSTQHFLANGLNVAIFGRPSDTEDLDYADRIGEPHMEDLTKALAFVATKSPAPVWLVGTSRGSISAAAYAIRRPAANFAGIVLTSSVVGGKKIGALPTQNLAQIRKPTLVVHHSKDACGACKPEDVPAVMAGLKNAPVKKLIWFKDGAGPRGEPCQALHWHGFIGAEKAAVDLIAQWIRQPTSK